MGCLPPPPRHPRPAARALGLTLALPNVSVSRNLRGIQRHTRGSSEYSSVDTTDYTTVKIRYDCWVSRRYTTHDATRFRDAWAPHTQTQGYG